jgi:hypothetical protein
VSRTFLWANNIERMKNGLKEDLVGRIRTEKKGTMAV